MRHIHHHQGQQFIADGEIPFTHVVMGQRDIEAARPKIPVARKPGDAHYIPTPEELATLAQFTFDESRGKFAVKVLAWAASEEVAAALAARFAAPEWINVKIHELDPSCILPYA